MTAETLLTFRAIARARAKESFDGYEPSYSSHGEDFHELYVEFQEKEEGYLADLKDAYAEIAKEINDD